jgi:uncharacterized OB-fold protein
VPSSDTAWVDPAALPALTADLTPAFPEIETAFWTGGSDGGLHLQRCRACGAWAHPPLPRCRECRSEDIGPERASGWGQVYSFTVNYQPWIPALQVPYVVAVVAPEEAPRLRLFTNLVEVGVEEVHIAMNVEVAPVDIGDGVWLPAFRPRRSEQA